MEHNVLIGDMLQEDWEQVRAIYLEGIATGQATFQKEAPSWEEWDRGHVSECRIVARYSGKVVGWAALTAVSSRCVYAGVAEVSVYVSQRMIGKGVGSNLLDNLIRRSEEQGFWTLQSSIFPKNAASIKIHIKNGFRELGRRERIGKMDGVWRDTVLLERRSDKVGVN
ncbi:N-acetyltransferase family protein [Bacillus sp. JJ1609]|uniref:GNAT family N-acetyltransferase n=1 Tax=Bacillus sp. JJ1609 TaxID=3122977 RepID=UPI002FFDBD75